MFLAQGIVLAALALSAFVYSLKPQLLNCGKRLGLARMNLGTDYIAGYDIASRANNAQYARSKRNTVLCSNDHSAF